MNDFFFELIDDTIQVIDPVTWVVNNRYAERGRRMTFERHYYLTDILRSPYQDVMLLSGRGVGKTQTILNWLLYNLLNNDGTVALYTSNRSVQVRRFSVKFLRDAFLHPNIKKMVDKNSLSVHIIKFKNNSLLYCYSSWRDADTIRNIRADFLAIDEGQEFKIEQINVVKEVLEGSEFQKTMIAGTGGSSKSDFAELYRKSTKKMWVVPCTCGEKYLMNAESYKLIDENMKEMVCPKCNSVLMPEYGHWRTIENGSSLVSFYIPQWLRKEYDRVLEKKEIMPEFTFMSEVAGWFSRTHDVPITHSTIYKAYTGERYHALPKAGYDYYLGIDWGGGGVSRTVVFLGTYVNGVLRVCNIWKMDYSLEKQIEEIEEIIASFRPLNIVADVGNARLQHEIFREKYRANYWGCKYFSADRGSKAVKIDFEDRVVMIDKTYALELIFSALKRGFIKFDVNGLDWEWIIDDFLNIYVDYREKSTTPKKLYKKVPGKTDDALHSLVYLYIASVGTQLPTKESSQFSRFYMPVWG